MFLKLNCHSHARLEILLKKNFMIKVRKYNFLMSINNSNNEEFFIHFLKSPRTSTYTWHLKQISWFSSCYYKWLRSSYEYFKGNKWNEILLTFALSNMKTDILQVHVRAFLYSTKIFRFYAQLGKRRFIFEVSHENIQKHVFSFKIIKTLEKLWKL